MPQRGFAHPAIDFGLPASCEAAKAQGIAALAVTNSYNCGVVGYHVERIARAGRARARLRQRAGLDRAGGRRQAGLRHQSRSPSPCRARGREPLVLDQSSSVVAKSEIVVAPAARRADPLGWAFDKEGKPTTDPAAALAGTMVPAGGYKGAGLALIVELFAAWLTGANLSIDASSFADNLGGSPRTGQFFIAIDSGATAGPDATARLEHLFGAILEQEGARLPGERRIKAKQRTAAQGVTIAAALLQRLRSYAA